MTPKEFETHMQKISKNVMEMDDQNENNPGGVNHGVNKRH